MKEVPLVLLGFGGVGRALGRLLERRNGFRDLGARLHLVAVLDRGGAAVGESLSVAELVSAKEDHGSVAAHPRWGRRDVSIDEILDFRAHSILVDASPTDAVTGEPGLSAIRRTMERGRPAVLASKGPLVVGFRQLMELAGEKGGRIGFSAAVGTPLPSLETALVGLHGCRIKGFRGLLNETSNRILRDMESGVPYEEAVEGAREAGVLESDPRLDLEGWDTAFKVLILARSLWDPEADLEPTAVRGIAGISPVDLARAVEGKRKLRLIGSARRDESGRVDIRVEPVWLDVEDPLHPLGPGEKGAVFDTDLMGRVVIRSGKAGPFATAAAIVKDVLNIVSHPQGIVV